MKGLVCVLGLLLVHPALGLHCHDDITLTDPQEYTYTIPGYATGSGADGTATVKEILEYWGNFHINFFVFGSFAGNPTDSVSPAKMSAGLYMKNGSLIHSLEIDCSANTWTTYITLNTTGLVTVYQSGELETSCVEGENFDMWFKIQQQYMMQWIYNEEAMQYGYHRTSFNKGARRLRTQKGHGYTPSAWDKWRFRPLSIPMMHTADKAHSFRLSASGAASFKRFAFGKCIAWPEELSSNCTAANNWFTARDKNDEPAGQYGNSIKVWMPQCASLGSIYWDHLNEVVKPDENVPSSKNPQCYCCCTDMTTGLVYGGPDKWDTYCAVYSPDTAICPMDSVCMEVTYNSALYAEALGMMDDEDHEEEEGKMIA